MKCPRCSAVFTGVPDEHGYYSCPQCGAKLRARSTGKAHAAARAAPAPVAQAHADPTATLPPETPMKPIPRPGDPPASLDLVLAEIRSVRRMQEDLLAMLRSRPAEPAAADTPLGDSAFGDSDEIGRPASAPAAADGSALRARRRKTVLLIDDDDKTRSLAMAALEAAQVPSRAVKDGAAGLQAIAHEKPDVIVLELGVGGEMAGKDAINMIKATMEWVDIPIVLYTRLAIENQKEARTIHGADELVPKGPGSPEMLVQRVIQVFRRG